MIVIGITGPTGAGKTTTLMELEKLGGAVIDCDAVYHEMLESDLALQNKLSNTFGAIRDSSGGIDRKKLGKIVFGDPEQLEKLDSIVHEAIRNRVWEMIEKFRAENRYRAAAIDAIGLFESGLGELCDTTLAITAPAEVRIGRIMAREGISEEYARSRVEAQKPERYFLDRCQHVLINDCPSREAFAERSHALLLTLL